MNEKNKNEKFAWICFIAFTLFIFIISGYFYTEEMKDNDSTKLRQQFSWLIKLSESFEPQKNDQTTQ